MSAVRIDAAKVQVDDVLIVLGHEHRIRSIEPYEGPLFDDARIAKSDNDWCLTLVPGHYLWAVERSP